jgi:hypothetical protein
MTQEAPEVHSKWVHYKSKQVYVVCAITNTAHPSDNYPVTVVYKNKLNETLWSRKLSDWHRSFTPVGAFE